MSINNVFEVHTSVFIAGVLMPAMSITVTTSFNSVPMATIAFAPDPRLYGIGRRDRVPVHIFLQDTFSELTEDKIKQGAPYLRPEHDKDILFFEGEITSFAYNSTAIGKEVVLNAQGVMAFFKDVNIRIMQTTDDYATASIPGEQYKAMETTGTLQAAMPSHLFTHGLFTSGGASSDNSKPIKFPYEFLANSVRYLMEPVTENLKTPVWDFFNKYSKSLNLNDRIIKVPCFDDGQYMPTGSTENGFPILRALQSTVAMSTLSKIGADAMQAETLYDFINIVMRNMEYEVAFPNAPTPVKEDGKLKLPTMYLKPILYEALPPMCNVIYASMSESIRTTEKIYGVPTRIQTRDVKGVLGTLAHGSNSSTLAAYGYTNFWPRGEENTDKIPNNKNPGVSRLINSEKYTGPSVYATEAPRWMSYLAPDDDNSTETTRKFNDDIRKHMLLLKIYELRDMQINIPFNPYLTVGYPVVIYDSEDTGFIFLGQLLTVEHSISESSVSTSASVGFVRLLEDELDPTPPVPGNSISSIITDVIGGAITKATNPDNSRSSLSDITTNAVDTILGKAAESVVQQGKLAKWEEEQEDVAATDVPLENTFTDISDNVTKKEQPMKLVYNKLLGCDPVPSFQDLKTGRIAGSKAHTDPAVAYKENFRKIVTLLDYEKFMGLSLEFDEAGKCCGFVENDSNTSGYITKRRRLASTKELRPLLKEIAADIRKNEVYATSFSM